MRQAIILGAALLWLAKAAYAQDEFPESAPLGSYECIHVNRPNTSLPSSDPNVHEPEPGGTNEGYPLLIGDPRPGLNFSLEPAGVYVDAEGTHGAFEYLGGRLLFTGGILDAIAAVIWLEEGRAYAGFEAHDVQCTIPPKED